MFSLPEHAKLVQGIAPAADAGGRTGDYASLKGAHMLFVVFNITQGNAATILLSLSEATAVLPAGAQAVTATFPIWSNLDCAATDTLVRRTDAANYTTDAGVKNKVIVFQIDPAILTVASGYDCLAAVTGASNAANITAAMYYLVPHRYAGDQPPSAILD